MGRLVPAGAPERVRCKLAAVIEDECDDEDRDAIQSWLDASYGREAISTRMASAFDVGVTTCRKHQRGECRCTEPDDVLHGVYP